MAAALIGHLERASWKGVCISCVASFVIALDYCKSSPASRDDLQQSKVVSSQYVPILKGQHSPHCALG